MKKVLCFLAAACFLFSMAGCTKTKTLHCDKCNKEISVKEESDMNDDWGIYCKDCHEEIFNDNPIFDNK